MLGFTVYSSFLSSVQVAVRTFTFSRRQFKLALKECKCCYRKKTLFLPQFDELYFFTTLWNLVPLHSGSLSQRTVLASVYHQCSVALSSCCALHCLADCD